MKYPEKGKVKTRLARELGDDFVYNLYRCFIDDILESTKNLPYETIISCYSCSTREITHFLGEDFRYEDQNGADLGERMYNAIRDAFDKGFDQIVLFGSDIPDISVEILSDAFKGLEKNDIVIGPSADGGYYLIGFNRDSLRRELFSDVTWSTSLVLFETLTKIELMRLSCLLLDELYDIDEMDDLKTYYRHHMDSNTDSRTMVYLKKHEEKLNDQV